MDQTIIAENAAQTRRLKELTARLTDADLAHDVGGGWTVSMVLAHAAFWDRRTKVILDHWAAGEPPPTNEAEWYDDLPNTVLPEEWRLIPGRDAARLAIEAAEVIDRTVAGLDDATADAVREANQPRRLARSAHRQEHLDQIESALAPA